MDVTTAIPSVFVITPFRADVEFFRGMGDAGRWNIVVTGSVEEALQTMGQGLFPVVVCDRDIPGWEWRDVMSAIAGRFSRTCILLSSRVSDEYLWREVVKHGGYDLLTKPLEATEVSRALQRTFCYWKAKFGPG